MSVLNLLPEEEKPSVGLANALDATTRQVVAIHVGGPIGTRCKSFLGIVDCSIQLTRENSAVHGRDESRSGRPSLDSIP